VIGGPAQPARVRRALLAWYARHARELPWRSRRDPWRVWVSETMLQQTRVEAVIEPYRRFIAAFPTLTALARAHEDEVLARWSGLGYYRRARLLHAGARFVKTQHRGRIPRSREELERVPGIGAYTAAALLSIAFGEPQAAVDANVARVVARLRGIADPRSPGGRVAARQFASALVDCARPGDVNEALMDLGSAICTARIARCQCCPLARMCRARKAGDVLRFAASRPRKPPRPVQLVCAVVTDARDRVLFVRRAPGDALLAGLWDLPGFERGDAPSPPRNGAESPCDAEALKKVVHAGSGLRVDVGEPLLSLRHDIVGRRITATVHVSNCGGNGRLAAGARFLSREELESVGLPALPLKILRALDRRARAPRFPTSRDCAARGAA